MGEEGWGDERPSGGPSAHLAPLTTKLVVDNTKTFVYRLSMPEIPRPTDAELSILRVLWRRGPSTVKEVNDELARRAPTGYTTTLKQLQIMTEKGLVTRDESQRAHLYLVRLPEEQTQTQLVGDLLDRAFEGSASRLVLRALSSRPAKPEELAEIRELLDRLEGDTK
jgi:BlaI family penicillinase repressor